MIVRLAAGILLGVFFYGGLWMTIRHLATTRHPLALSAGSFLLRMAVTLTGFKVVMHGRWQNAVPVLLGFTVVRVYLRFAVRSVKRSTPCT